MTPEDLKGFLIRPEAYLARLASSGSLRLDFRFLDAISSLPAYPYFTDFVLLWVDSRISKGAIVATQDEWKVTLRTIDTMVFSHCDAHDAVHIMQPLFVLFEGNLPKTILIDFFQDKGAAELVSLLRSDVRNSFASSELEQFLNALLDDLSEVVHPSATNTTSTIVTEKAEVTSYSGFLQELQSAGVPLVSPSSYRYTPPEDAPANRIAKKEHPKKSRNPPDRTDQKFERMAVQSNQTIESPEPIHMENSDKKQTDFYPNNETYFPPIEQFISHESRKKLVRKLFEGNTASYDRSVALLNKSENWRQASVYLDAIFLRNKINPYSKHALRLSEAVLERFTYKPTART